MKRYQPNKGVPDKKRRITPSLLNGGSSAGAEMSKSTTVFGAPANAVWSKYIDSRMKQFSTR